METGSASDASLERCDVPLACRSQCGPLVPFVLAGAVSSKRTAFPRMQFGLERSRLARDELPLCPSGRAAFEAEVVVQIQVTARSKSVELKRRRKSASSVAAPVLVPALGRRIMASYLIRIAHAYAAPLTSRYIRYVSAPQAL